ncbi:MAG: HAD-IA family hydrolase [Rhodobacteraceae bacterium]|nr:HAD-IA family hydrolase [Paracoccaceae bacterium]
MNNPLRLVVFDMDGTLIDSADFIKRAMVFACEEAGRTAPAAADIQSIIGLSLPEAVMRLMPELGAADVAETVQIYKNSFIELREKEGGESRVEMYDGALDALDMLSSQPELLMGLATGKARRGVDHAFHAHGIGDYFVTIQTADTHPSKPHPSMLEQALRETGSEAQNSVIVGDTSYDIEMGRAAGFKTVGVTWGYHSSEVLMSSGADILINSFGQLSAALDQLWSGG